MQPKIVYIIIAGFLVFSQPTVVLANDFPNIFKIKVSGCETGSTDRRLTGFLLKGVSGIITALHGVVGCQIITATQSGGKGNIFRELEISQADIRNDIAVLTHSGLAALNSFAFPPASNENRSQNLKVVGFPKNINKVLSTSVKVRPEKRISWNDMNSAAINKIKIRKSPGLDVDMLNIEGHIVPGHSGAPIINGKGEVLGVANGGLDGGRIEIALGTPVRNITLQPKKLIMAELNRLAKLDPGDLFSDGERLSSTLKKLHDQKISEIESKKTAVKIDLQQISQDLNHLEAEFLNAAIPDQNLKWELNSLISNNTNVYTGETKFSKKEEERYQKLKEQIDNQQRDSERRWEDLDRRRKGLWNQQARLLQQFSDLENQLQKLKNTDSHK